jgi:hypothetical protein
MNWFQILMGVAHTTASIRASYQPSQPIEPIEPTWLTYALATVGAIFAALLVVFLTLGADYLVFRDRHERAKVAEEVARLDRYQKVDGTLDSAERSAEFFPPGRPRLPGQDTSPSWETKVLYRYKVGERDYRGYLLSPPIVNHSSMLLSSDLDEVLRFPEAKVHMPRFAGLPRLEASLPSQPITVYYDPANPANSYLVKVHATPNLAAPTLVSVLAWLLALFLAFIGLYIGCVIATWVRRFIWHDFSPWWTVMPLAAVPILPLLCAHLL